MAKIDTEIQAPELPRRTQAHEGKVDGSKASYPAVPISQNNHRFYFTTIPVTDLFPYCFVARRDEDPKLGFQRSLNQDRAADIARYLDDSKGSIPTNIVLSAQPDTELEYKPSKKTLRYKRIKYAFLVLDGQHRLFGYSQTRKPHRVPVAIYENLGRRDEAGLFIDINTNQRGVPAALLLDIKQIAEQESVDETKLRKIFDRLDSDSQSSLAGYLSKSKSTKGYISRVSFNKGVKPLLNNGIVRKLSDEGQYTLIRNYFTAVESALGQAKLLRRSAYFEAFCETFDDVIKLARQKHEDYKLESLKDILGAIGNVDLETIPTGGRTNVTKAAIIPILRGALTGQVDVTEDMV